METRRLTEYNEVRSETLAARFRTWQTLLRELKRTASRDHTVVRFPNASSYLFSTGDCLWAVDPVYARGPCPAEEFEAVVDGLRDFDFIVLTHCHADHLHVPFLQKICGPDEKQLVIPASIAPQFFKLTGLPAKDVTVLEAGESAVFSGVTLTCHPGYHDEPGTAGYPSGSFLVALPDGINLFFPTDIRDYSRPMPAGMPPIDFEFGHIWLGRGNSHEEDFPMVDAFCRFMLQCRPGVLFLTHLREVSRSLNSMWLPRHAAMVRARLAELAPETVVSIPCPGDVLTLSKPFRKDRFADWPRQAQREFLDHLGVSIRLTNWSQAMDSAVRDRVPVLELSGSLPPSGDLARLALKLADWRTSGGRLLSAHLADILPGQNEASHYQVACDTFLSLGINRVTQHVPRFSVAEYTADPDRIVNLFAEAFDPLIRAGITIGIENMHMKAHTPPGKLRPYGFTPDECLAFVDALRRRTGYRGIGFHFDIGHAATNHPYTEQFPTEAWLAAGRGLINGVHLHQYETPPAEGNYYPEGHFHVSGRTCGYPDLSPLYAAWEAGSLRAPLFLEVRKGPERDPFPSLARLRACGA
jgi:hypothetical protein